MDFPGERALLAERTELVATLAGLSDDEFDHGPTLCAGWSPRDILAHLVGLEDDGFEYVRHLGRISRANAAIVERWRAVPRSEMAARADRFATTLAPMVRASATFLLGDTAVHHQDILRGLGLEREIPRASRAAILREGVVLGGYKLLRTRVEPTDGGRALGRGRVVRGTTEALGLWLAGRQGLEDELTSA